MMKYYLYLEANGQLNRKVKVVRESKSYKDTIIPWEVIRRDLMKFYYYKITNIKNGSFYIGITTNFEKRKYQHLYNL